MIPLHLLVSVCSKSLDRHHHNISLLLTCLANWRTIIKKNFPASDLKKSCESFSIISASVSGYPGGFDPYCLHYIPVLATVLQNKLHCTYMKNIHNLHLRLKRTAKTSCTNTRKAQYLITDWVVWKTRKLSHEIKNKEKQSFRSSLLMPQRNEIKPSSMFCESKIVT